MYNINNINCIRPALLALLALLGTTEVLAADAAASAVAAPPVFARVGDVVITQQQFDATFAAMNRGRFFHGRPPEEDIATMQRDTGNKLVVDALLLREAKRLKLKPDAAEVRKKIELHEQKYADDTQWQQARAQDLPLLTRQWQEESLPNMLEKRVRAVPSPKGAQLRQYYAAHPDKFTEPEQLRVSVILLRVDPSSPAESWQQTQAEAQDLVKQLRAGADFARLAREHSGDLRSAQQGGDLGYLHGGMLSAEAQAAVDKLKSGETSDPVRVLEGIIVLRVTDRQQPALGSFASVRERARGLWLKEEGERAWQALIERLKKETPVFVDESRYLPLPAVAKEMVAPKKR